MTVNAIAASLGHSTGTEGFDYLADVEALRVIKRAQQPTDLTAPPRS